MKQKIIFSMVLFLLNLEVVLSQIWIKTDSLPVGIVESIAVNPKNGKILAGIYGEGVFRSDNNGTNWIKVSSGLPDKLVKVIRFSSAGSAFVGLNGKGIFRTTDDGQNWIESNNGLTNKNILDIFVSRDGKLYAGTWFYGSVFVSTDNGASWTDMKLDNKDVHAIVAAKDGSVLAGTEYNGLYKTSDNGNSWKSVGFSSNNIYDMVVDSEGRIFLGAKDGLYISDNNGESWTAQNKGIGANLTRAITISKARSIFAGTSSGIFRSIDNGVNWTEYNDGIDNYNKNIFSISCGIDDIIYAGTAMGIYKTLTADNIEEMITPEFNITIYPQPFIDNLSLNLKIIEAEHYILSIFDIYGNKIETLLDNFLLPGSYTYIWRPSNTNSGFYFYRLSQRNKVRTGKIIYHR
jgi:photosystem II stability/assembly factor-like uncharacterized protein